MPSPTALALFAAARPYRLLVDCSRCDGTGDEPGSTFACEECHGEGAVEVPDPLDTREAVEEARSER